MSVFRWLIHFFKNRAQVGIDPAKKLMLYDKLKTNHLTNVDMVVNNQYRKDHKVCSQKHIGC